MAKKKTFFRRKNLKEVMLVDYWDKLSTKEKEFLTKALYDIYNEGHRDKKSLYNNSEFYNEIMEGEENSYGKPMTFKQMLTNSADAANRDLLNNLPKTSVIPFFKTGYSGEDEANQPDNQSEEFISNEEYYEDKTELDYKLKTKDISEVYKDLCEEALHELGINPKQESINILMKLIAKSVKAFNKLNNKIKKEKRNHARDTRSTRNSSK